MFIIRSRFRSTATGWLAGAFVASLLAGCAALTPPEDDPLAGSVRACMAENVHFSDAWGCVQAKYAAEQINGADPRLKAFLVLGDDLAQQVEFKKLSDAKARERLLAGLPGPANEP